MCVEKDSGVRFLVDELNKPAFLLENGQFCFANRSAKEQLPGLFKSSGKHPTLNEIISRTSGIFDIKKIDIEEYSVFIFYEISIPDHTRVVTERFLAEMRERLSSEMSVLSTMEKEAYTMNGNGKTAFGILKRNLLSTVHMVSVAGLLSDCINDAAVLEPELVDLTGRIYTVTRESRDLMKNSGVDIRFKSSLPQPFNARVDMRKLETALLSLISNGIKYGDGQVTVILRADDKNIFISVHDNGPGLSPAQALRVRRAFMLPPDTSNPKAGIGFGLALVNEITALHGGELIIGDGPGCTMTMRIPYEPEITLDSKEPMVLRAPFIYTPGHGFPRVMTELADVADSSRYEPKKK